MLDSRMFNCEFVKRF
ncbi:hypothetical protein Tsp_12096, partial [Trichinella spiralis]